VHATGRLAVFDLDGTITRHDSFVPYVLGFLKRRPWRVPRLLLALPAVVGFFLQLVGRGPLKSAIIRAALGGVTRTDLERWNQRYVPRLLADGLFPQALQAIAAHRAAGDTLILMSASPDLYVPEVGRRLGFTQTICTGVRWQDDRLDGHLGTENRRGEEKTRCLEALRRAHPGMPVTAYGNTGSDLPHLARAERGVLVNGSASSRRHAADIGVQTVDWN
jgi:phosphatidylglycerophosphatase C